jgi:Calcineurin-like phosphoesterase
VDAPDSPAPPAPTPTPYQNPADRARAVRWLSPTELARTGLKVLLGSLFGQYVDKRELQQGPSFDQGLCFDHNADAGPNEPYWLDFVSDIGDGFDPTYSVASLLAGDLHGLEGSDRDVLRRGSVLVMGGDEVYPSGDVRNYERRTTGVYATALPTAAEPRPVAYAIPGNHDWYDGLTSFLRIFGQSHDIGGWATQQRRSYFALRLPHHWWLFGLDIQLNTYIDRPQLEYFREAATRMVDGDRLILCTAKPAWYVQDPRKSVGMVHLTHFLKYTLAGRDLKVPLVLSGDTHHYARYETVDEGRPQNLITAGIGGAFLASTDPLREDIKASRRLSDPDASRHESRPYRLRKCWPSAERSRVLSGGGWRVPFRNPSLPMLFALFQAGFIAAAMRDLLSVLIGLVALAVAGSISFARPRQSGAWVKRGWGVSLAVPQLAMSWGIAELCSLIADDWSDVGVVATVGVAALVSGWLAGLLLGVWMIVVSRFQVNVLDLFAAQSIEDYKGFLRLRIDPDGSLTVYPIGIERRVQAWQPGPEGGGPRLLPAAGEALRPTLLEPPIRLTP